MADLFAYLDGFGTGGSLTKSVIIVTDLPTGSTVTATGYVGDAVKSYTPRCTTAQWDSTFYKVNIPQLEIGTEVLFVAIISADAATRVYFPENVGFSTSRVFLDLVPGENTILLPQTVMGTISNEASYFYKSQNDGVKVCGISLKVLATKREKNANEKNGEWRFNNIDIGEWTLRASLGDQSTDTKFSVTQFGVYRVPMQYSKTYGIMRDITAQSPEWARTDDAVGFTATASVGMSAGHSDFDACYPWSGIERETLSTGDVMVKIPKFWFLRYRDGSVEYIKISDKQLDGFDLHPAFERYGVQKDAIYVGAYKTSNNNKSVSNATPQGNQTRAVMRTNAKEKGSGWGLIDIGAVSAIQMLILTEFANNNVQSVIGRGYVDNNGVTLITGTCDSVPGLTGRPSGTDGKIDVVWRGIEGFWGNIWEMVDGVNWYNGEYYICNDPSKYADNTSENYTLLSFTGETTWNNSYITQTGLDEANNHVFFPKFAGTGSETTFECDACSSRSGWKELLRSGGFTSGSTCGLFISTLYYDSSYSSGTVGSRLMYIPEVE